MSVRLWFAPILNRGVFDGRFVRAISTAGCTARASAERASRRPPKAMWRRQATAWPQANHADLALDRAQPRHVLAKRAEGAAPFLRLLGRQSASVNRHASLLVRPTAQT